MAGVSLDDLFGSGPRLLGGGSSPAESWQIDPAVQAERDGVAKQLVSAELKADPGNQALRAEFAQRFGGGRRAANPAKVALSSSEPAQPAGDIFASGPRLLDNAQPADLRQGMGLNTPTLANLKVHEPPAPRPERSMGQAVGDTAKQLAKGTNVIAGALPNLIAPDGELAKFFNDNAQTWDESQSEAYKQRRAGAQQRIQEAAKRGGTVDEILTAASEYMGDPALASGVIVETLPSMIPTIGAVKGIQLAAVARGATAARAAQLGMAGAGATNAALNAGGARQDAFQTLSELPEDAWAKDPEYVALRQQNMSHQQAAVERAKSLSLVPAAVGGIVGFLTGRTGLESALVGKGAGSAARRVGSEMLGEQVEELAPQLAGNVQANRIDPSRSITEGLGTTAVQTAIGSGPGGIAAGFSGGDQQQLPVMPPEAQTAPQPQQQAAPAAQPFQNPLATGKTLDQLSTERDQVSARIAALRDVMGRAQSRETFGEMYQQMQELEREQDILAQQMQYAVNSGAANPTAQNERTEDPDALMRRRVELVTEFVADKTQARALREADPEAWSEFLRAYRVALNPTMSATLRERAMDGIDAYFERQGLTTSLNGAYQRLEAEQPAPANIVPFAAPPVIRPGDPQGRMVAGADGTVRPAFMDEVAQPDPNEMQGQVLSSREDLMQPDPLRADARGNVGDAQGFEQLRGQEQNAQRMQDAAAETAASTPARLPYTGDAKKAAEPGAGLTMTMRDRVKRADMRMRGIDPEQNSPAMAQPEAQASTSQEIDNGQETRQTQTEAGLLTKGGGQQAQSNPAAPASSIDEAAHAAAPSPLNDLAEPTDAQKRAGNYAKGHTRIAGLDISIENPEGSTRSGTDPNGERWENRMAAHYGYIRGTVGKDKDHIDVFIKPGVEDFDGTVFVIDQKKANGQFDEHKVMLGYATEEDARKAYQDSYSEGWDGIRSVTAMDMPAFKQWIAEGDHTKPAAPVTKAKKINRALSKETNAAEPEQAAAQAEETSRPEVQAEEPAKSRSDVVWLDDGEKRVKRTRGVLMDEAEQLQADIDGISAMLKCMGA